MFINKTKEGKNNICGPQVALYRKGLKLSQKKFADKLQLVGLDMEKNAVQRIESGQRFVTDIELLALSKVLGVTTADLLKTDREKE